MFARLLGLTMFVHLFVILGYKILQIFYNDKKIRSIISVQQNYKLSILISSAILALAITGASATLFTVLTEEHSLIYAIKEMLNG